jgi:membrane protease YdiL (CAAX protease family)
VGDWRAGLGIALAGCAVMTPVVIALARVDAFAAYYAPQGASAPEVLLTTALEVIPAEFFYRGFLLFALLRVVGPIAVVIATLPFAFAHLGKPEVETLSTLGGGLLYGWLDWRTGSVLWSGLAHTWLLSLVVIAAAATGTSAP